MSESCCATPALLPPLPIAARRARRGRVLTTVARTGTVVTLLALGVLGATVGGSLGSAAPTERPTVTVTYGR